jgi:hypothetical protein
MVSVLEDKVPITLGGNKALGQLVLARAMINAGDSDGVPGPAPDVSNEGTLHVSLIRY